MKGKLLVFILSCLICAALSEILLRHLGWFSSYGERNKIYGYVSPYDSNGEKWYHVYPPHILIENSYPLKESFMTNNEGCRDIDFVKDTTRKRIFMIGDSFTEGIGASNDSTISQQLNNLFKKAGYTDVDIWNGGISGSDPVFEYRFYKDKLLKYHPNAIILVVNTSDIGDIKTRGGFSRFNKDSTVTFNKGPWFEPYYAKSILVRTIVHDVFRYDWQFIRPSQQNKYKKNANNYLIQAVDSFNNLCCLNNCKLLIAYHPKFDDFRNSIGYDFMPVIDFCKLNKIQCIDIREAFYTHGVTTKQAAEYYWEIDGHYNNKGYNLFAQCIFEASIKLTKP
jgi:lysophospholipase L1-like esterase